MQNQRAHSRRIRGCFLRAIFSLMPPRPILRQLALTASLPLSLALTSCGGLGTSETGKTGTDDFSFSAVPSSVTVGTGAVGSQVAVLVTSIGSFSGTVTVTVSKLSGGVTVTPPTLTLTPGNPQNITLAAAFGAAASMQTITLTGASGSLMHTASFTLTVNNTAPDVTTYHYDNARDGLNARENVLTLSNVNSSQFGKVGFDAVDGLVDAEPLYLANVTAGGLLRDVLYVVTEHGSVYAFDADSGVQIWKTSILGSGETTSDNHGCGQITPEIGITSTPVIDRNQGPNGTLFTVGMSKDASGNYHQRLHALDLTTGAELAGSPAEITGSYPGTGANSVNGNVIFDPGQYAERAALLLVNGAIYSGWTSHCDEEPYTGWVMAFSESTLKQTQIINLTPNGSEGSIWMSGDGIAADSNANLYFLDANGTFDAALNAGGFPARGDFGNAIVKLATGGKLAVADYFETYDTIAESNADEDLGSGGEILLPDQTDANGVVRHLLIGAGKDANIYVADRDNMGKINTAASNDSNIYQIVSGQLGGMVFSTPAFFNGTLYYGAVGDNLKAFPMNNAKLNPTPSSRSVIAFGHPGTTPSITANGTQNGIVWALESSLNTSAVLRAYDASNLSRELYDSNEAPNNRDSFGNGNKFITPMVVNGKVYIGTTTGVAVFGLLNP